MSRYCNIKYNSTREESIILESTKYLAGNKNKASFPFQPELGILHLGIESERNMPCRCLGQDGQGVLGSKDGNFKHLGALILEHQ